MVHVRETSREQSAMAWLYVTRDVSGMRSGIG